MSVTSPPSPPVTSTVITVTGRHSSHHDSTTLPTAAESSLTSQSRRTSAPTNQESKSGIEFPEIVSDQKSVLANTHIIRVSGPVTNLDEAPATIFPRERSSISEVQALQNLASAATPTPSSSSSTSGTTLSTSFSPLSTSPSTTSATSTILSQHQSSKFVQTSV